MNESQAICTAHTHTHKTTTMTTVHLITTSLPSPPFFFPPCFHSFASLCLYFFVCFHSFFPFCLLICLCTCAVEQRTELSSNAADTVAVVLRVVQHMVGLSSSHQDSDEQHVLPDTLGRFANVDMCQLLAGAHVGCFFFQLLCCHSVACWVEWMRCNARLK